MKTVIFCLLSANLCASLSLTFYRDPGYGNTLGAIDVNVGQCVYVGNRINDQSSSSRWADAANLNRCICFHDNYPCSGRTRCWEEVNRYAENFNYHGISNMISAVSLYNNEPNYPCYARNKD